MAIAPVKKKTPAASPLDDLDDLGPAPASTGSADAGPGEPGELAPVPSELAPVGPPAPVLRLLVRAACGLLIVAALGVYLLNPAAPMTAAKFDPASTVVVSLVQGSNYGQAIVYLGDGAVGDPLVDDESLKQALAGAVGDSGKSRLLIKASGGVHQREVDRVGRLILLAVPAERNIEIHVAPLESPP